MAVKLLCLIALAAVSACDSSSADITAFGFLASTNSELATDLVATIDDTAISVTAPFGTDVTGLKALFETTGVSVVASGTKQVSGVTATDFTNPVTYTVTAEDGAEKDYTVTIAVCCSPAKDITSFSFLAATNPGLSTDVHAASADSAIIALVPFGTDVTALKATFSTTGASVLVGSLVQTSGTSANSFTNPVTYTVVAADLSTRTYTVTVAIGPSPEKDIIAFSFASTDNPGFSGTATGAITGTSIAVTVPYGTTVNGLKARFTHTGAAVRVGTTPQTSGITANNYTSPVIYRVTAADGSTKDYVVTVTVMLNSAKDITSFAFTQANNPMLVADARATFAGPTITVPVRAGTDVTALKATFTTTGQTVTISAAPQTSAVTANDFTNPVTYTVTAEDGTTQSYIVTVAIGIAFYAGTQVPAGAPLSYTAPLAVGDINTDGRPDIVTVNGSVYTASVMLNTTAAGATSPTFIPYTQFATGFYPGAAGVGDLDGDSKPDIVVANNCGVLICATSTISVLVNTTGSGATTPTFLPKIDIVTSRQPLDVAVTDLNGDLKPDLAVVGFGTLMIFLNTTTTGATTPSFSAESAFVIATYPTSIRTADIDGDGRSDLVIPSDTVQILLNTTVVAATVPTFATPVNVGTTTSARVALGDVDGDGKVDLAIASGVATVAVHLNTTAIGAATASFGVASTFATGLQTTFIAIGDLDGNGKPDLAATNQGSNTVSVLRNSTPPGSLTPNFLSRIDFATSGTPGWIAIADFNADGKGDLVMVNSNSASVMLAQ